MLHGEALCFSQLALHAVESLTMFAGAGHRFPSLVAMSMLVPRRPFKIVG